MKIIPFLVCSWLGLHCPVLYSAPVANLYKSHTPPKEIAASIEVDYQTAKVHSPDLLKYAQDLIRKGDKFFAAKQYSKAYEAYELSSDNAGTAYARLQAGEAGLLGYITAKEFFDEKGKSTGACLPPAFFAEGVDEDLYNKYLVGIELAKISKAGRPISKARLADAEHKAACMQALADEYRGKKTGCMDMSKARACMGLPAR